METIITRYKDGNSDKYKVTGILKAIQVEDYIFLYDSITGSVKMFLSEYLDEVNVRKFDKSVCKKMIEEGYNRENQL